MKRAIEPFLMSWLASEARKPLLLRGARQVGKTWAVRQLARESQYQLIEINFEKNPQAISLFKSNKPAEILLNLEAFFNKTIKAKESILFLDEIQAAPELLAKLRWFFEDMPELAIVAAGSLLEFLLTEHSFSMPVGRISFAYLEPLSFEEFLLANKQHKLHQYISDFKLNQEIPLSIHEQLMTCFKEYTLIGGMPEAVASWLSEQSLKSINQIHNDLLATYRSDFAKYKGRLALARLEEVMMATPRMLGQKFVFSQVNQDVGTAALKQAVSLLNQAGICHPVINTSANALPLGSETNPKFFKELLLDVGLCSTALGLNYSYLMNLDDLILANKGAIAEQVVGQLLRTIEDFYIEPQLYYWQRTEAGSEAEVDYIIQHANQVVPIEVKAGALGRLKSLHLLMRLKSHTTAIKISSALPSVSIYNEYRFLSIPFYMVGQIHRLLN